MNAEPAATAAVVEPAASAPVGAMDNAVVVVKRSYGFNARLATAIAVAAAIVIMALLLLHRRGGRDTRPEANTAAIDTSTQAGGDVAIRSSQPDTAVAQAPVQNVPPVPQASTPIIRPGMIPSTPPTSTPQTVTPQVPGSTSPVTPSVVVPPSTALPATPPPTMSPITPPDTRRHEPARSIPPRVAMPAPSTGSPTNSASDTAAAVRPTDVCDSPSGSDQQQCLLSAIQRNDVGLNDVYHRLIAALRRQANVADGDPDPQSVVDLRNAESKWVDDRDAACRGTGDGPLYARARAQCFADQSARRLRELQQMLDAIPGGTGGK
jgi:uncharacterized protein YecT (DUF1311 family)